MKKLLLTSLTLASIFSAQTHAATLEERVRVLEEELMLAKDDVV